MGPFARPIPVMDKGRRMTNPAIDRSREEMLHAPEEMDASVVPPRFDEARDHIRAAKPAISHPVLRMRRFLALGRAQLYADTADCWKISDHRSGGSDLARGGSKASALPATPSHGQALSAMSCASASRTASLVVGRSAGSDRQHRLRKHRSPIEKMDHLVQILSGKLPSRPQSMKP